MTERRVSVFFYSSFIHLAVLKQAGLVPYEVAPATPE